ncbi:MurR/RpiR family transcriptional regulator [Georgenia sp. Z1344]|uniref:MurR/RpiR family transcriptional regulator n=1 Tax=Georgenia sp. Z1344 TaxID=3416706 RepID=UPI003CF7BAB1
MSFQDHVDAHRDDLTPSDRILVDELLSYPVEAPLWSGEELARRAGVHPAAATRLAQRLGYDGYLRLRDDLRQSHASANAGAGDRFRIELQETGEQSVLEQLLTTELETLAQLCRHVRQPQLDALADRIVGSRTTYLFARGNASVLAELMERRLRRFGIRTVVVEGTGRDVAERVLTMGADDTVLTFAFRRPPRHLVELLAHAERVGATTALVTDTLHTLTPAPSTVLSAPRGHQEGFASLSVPMAIANALVLTIARRHDAALLPTLDALDGLMSDFD